VGAGIGGFLNASFGNAPELIVALTALGHGLPDVVRASLAGSVASNLLLVLGLSLLVRTPGAIDRSSTLVSLATVGVAVLVLVVPAAAAVGGDPDRHELALLSVPFAVALLVGRVFFNTRMLRRQRAGAPALVPEGAWSLRTALATLALATVLTALVTDLLVGSLETFADDAHLSDFFVAAVIVAIVGNAAEHGSAVLVAARGNTRLAAEIPLASSSQVAGFLIPVVALLSWTIDPMSLSFRPVELAAMGGAAAAAAIVLAPRRPARAGGAALAFLYACVVVVFFLV
jgi:Ca2+:H+ antiporter